MVQFFFCFWAGAEAGGVGDPGQQQAEGDPTQKKKVSRYSLYIIIQKISSSSSSGSLGLKQTKRITDRQMDGWTDKPICPFNFFKVGGITMHKCRSYGQDKLNL